VLEGTRYVQTTKLCCMAYLLHMCPLRHLPKPHMYSLTRQLHIISPISVLALENKPDISMVSAQQSSHPEARCSIQTTKRHDLEGGQNIHDIKASGSDTLHYYL